MRNYSGLYSTQSVLLGNDVHHMNSNALGQYRNTYRRPRTYHKGRVGGIYLFFVLLVLIRFSRFIKPFIYTCIMVKNIYITFGLGIPFGAWEIRMAVSTYRKKLYISY